MSEESIGCKQRRALLIADCDETEGLLIKTYGLTGTKKIPVAPGTEWSVGNPHNETHDIYVIRMDQVDIEWLTKFSKIDQMDKLRAPLSEVYKRYYNSKFIDNKFDIVVVGTPDFLAKVKHRGIDVTPYDFRLRAGPVPSGELEFQPENCVTLDAIESFLIRRAGIRIVFRAVRNTAPVQSPEQVCDGLRKLRVEAHNVAQWRDELRWLTGYEPVFVSPNGVIPAGHTLIKNIIFPLFNS